MTNDLEEEGHKTPLPQGVSTDNVHAGSYAFKFDPGIEYGPGWESTWEMMGEPRKIQVRAWVNLPHSRFKAAIVVQVKRGDGVYYWRTFMLTNVVRRYGQWEQVHKTFVLPRGIEGSDLVRMYLWQFDQRQTWYIDDIVIERVD